MNFVDYVSLSFIFGLIVYAGSLAAGTYYLFRREANSPTELQLLRNENKALKGQLKYARRQADPVTAVNARFIASLQAKLHEHKLAYEGVRKLLADCHRRQEETVKQRDDALALAQEIYDAWKSTVEGTLK